MSKIFTTPSGFAGSTLVQVLRHSLRLVILLGIIGTGLVAHYRVFVTKEKINVIRAEVNPTLARRTALAMDDFFHSGDDQRGIEQKHLSDIRGNTWSADIYGFSVTDPLAGAESVASSRHITRSLLIGLILPVIATLLLGRFFCSWICPAGFLFDIADHLRSLLQKLGMPTRQLHLWRGNKYVLLIVGLILSAIIGIPILGAFYPPAVLGREISHLSASFFSVLSDYPVVTGISFSGFFIIGIILVETFISPRLWCRYVCPGGGLYSLLGATRLVRVRNDLKQCTSCTECVQVCPMGLNPMKTESPGIECDQCMLCLNSCPPGSLTLDFGLPKLSKKNDD
ncbi:MAG: 4Fe-4S binding protein [Verrucomicrobiales bacterium]|nr:4Fe-4S binding protein [Verrucomicrobiales bacterium]